jgi:hypothetical protein
MDDKKIKTKRSLGQRMEKDKDLQRLGGKSKKKTSV